jgi:hypothetical protein
MEGGRSIQAARRSPESDKQSTKTTHVGRLQESILYLRRHRAPVRFVHPACFKNSTSPETHMSFEGVVHYYAKTRSLFLNNKKKKYFYPFETCV